jgi:hypothetical protein
MPPTTKKVAKPKQAKPRNGANNPALAGGLDRLPDQKKVKKKGWQPPKGFKKTFALSTGKAEAKIMHGLDTVDVKVKIFGRNYRGVEGKGPIQTVKYRVPSTTVSVKLANGTVLKARSCCKPPDTFRAYIGVYQAVRRLLKADTKLAKQDHREIVENLCPGLFRKKPNIVN